MTEAERDAFIEDKLACEHEKSLALQKKLLDATRKVLEQKDLKGLLQTAADTARELIGARYAATGHGYVNGVFTIGGVSRSEGAIYTSLSEAFNVEKGGVYLDMLQEKNSIRLTDAEMRAHSVWSGLPKGHVPLRGLLGVQLVNVNGQPNGLMMVSDKEDGGDFTAEDETTLSQLAAIVSLALQHIEARLESEKEKRRLEALMKALPVGVSFSDDPSCQSITGNTAVLAQFKVRPEDNLSASAPNGNAPGRQVRYLMDGQQISDAELPLQNEEIITAQLALQENEKRLAADLDAMTRLQQLGTLFVREGELEPVLGKIVDAAIAISGADFGNIQILDPKSSELKIVAHRGFPEWWIDFWNSVSKGQGTCGTALEQGERIIVDDVEQSPTFIGTQALEIQLKAGVRAVFSLLHS